MLVAPVVCFVPDAGASALVLVVQHGARDGVSLFRAVSFAFERAWFPVAALARAFGFFERVDALVAG